MQFDYDTEFLEDGLAIETLSIGIRREDGAEYYAVVEDARWDRVRDHEWLMANVVPSLPGTWLGGQWYLDTSHGSVKPKHVIANELEEFFLQDGKHGTPELWAWYAAYDHVALCQFWGRMLQLPKGMPMWTNDIRQEMHRLGNPEMPQQTAGAHNALMDARFNRVRRAFLADYARRERIRYI